MKILFYDFMFLNVRYELKNGGKMIIVFIKIDYKMIFKGRKLNEIVNEYCVVLNRIRIICVVIILIGVN